MTPDIESVTAVITRVGGVPAIAPEQDIFEAGVASVDALQLLLELESSFDVAIPDDEFIAARTPQAILDLVRRLGAGAA
jgi:acyl carrier protein